MHQLSFLYGMIKRTSMAIIGLSFLFSMVIPASAATANLPSRPNILWIVAENIALDLACYGAENVSTPHIDGLAAGGIRYTKVYATSPVCAPSRSAFMTGMYQTSTDTHNMRSHRDDDFRLPPGVRPLTHRLQDVGYYTANITHIGKREVGTGKLDLNFVNEGPIYQSKDWSQLKHKQPFFAQINTPEVEYDIYDRKSAEKPRVKWVGEEWHPRVATAENVTPPSYYPDHPITRQEWARYLNSISGMDVRVGWILDQLKRDGLADNTIVVFFGDNGRLTPRGIHWCWDPGLHVPLIIYWPPACRPPSGYRAGAVNHQVISLLDITATTLAMAGIPRPAGMQSRIFLGENTDRPRTYAFAARDRIDETVVRLRSVNDKRYHYIRNFTEGAGFPTLNRYKEKCFLVKPLMRQMAASGTLTGPAADMMKPFPREMLYDTEVDPHEIENLASSTRPEHRSALLRMRAALDTWIIETGDLGEWPEAPEIVAPFEKEMHDWFGTPDWVERNAYVFTYFMGNGEDGLHLAYSTDGLHWKALKGGRSFLTPQVGTDKLMRDPCVIQGPDGLFHMVWTVSWKEKGIGYAHSPDLIHWSEQKYIPVMEHEAKAKNTWAPEVFYDESTRQYLIFWATTIPGRFPETDDQSNQGPPQPGNNHRMYYVTTRDFKTFSDTQIFYNHGFNVIDATLVKTQDRYVMFLKDESNRPFTPQKNIKVASSDRAEGPYSPASEPITGDYWCEGPTTLKIGDWWYVYFDKYRKHQYGAVRSRDLKNWEDISDQITHPKGMRHGTVIEVSQDVLKKLLAQ